MSKVKEQYRDVSGGVTERTRVLSKLMEELELIKREMDERGSSMTDGSKWKVMYNFVFDFIKPT